MEDFMQSIIAFATTYGIRIVGAIAVLIVGRIAAGLVRGSVRRVMSKRAADPTLVNFASSLAYYLIMVFTVVAALANFGVQVASFVAVLGAASFAVGFALQGSLANFAAGVMILLFRPFKIGDYITAAGVSGSVKNIDLFSTTLATPDNVKIIVPNGKLFGDTIHNYAGYDTRRVDLLIGIGYTSSIGGAESTIESIIQADDRIHADPAPMIAVSELADSSVNLVVRVWVKREDYWGVKFDLTRKIKEQFDANDIEIPFPQRVVHNVAVTS
ncbi:MAG: mechanosensitive ion channel [Candidatus Latescibacterota bacterium]|nr:MAG: mechanosensitive ion channel [Candidatus Latescibacterota bacterium]